MTRITKVTITIPREVAGGQGPWEGQFRNLNAAAEYLDRMQPDAEASPARVFPAGRLRDMLAAADEDPETVAEVAKLSIQVGEDTPCVWHLGSLDAVGDTHVLSRMCELTLDDPQWEINVHTHDGQKTSLNAVEYSKGVRLGETWEPDQVVADEEQSHEQQQVMSELEGVTQRTEELLVQLKGSPREDQESVLEGLGRLRMRAAHEFGVTTPDELSELCDVTELGREYWDYISSEPEQYGLSAEQVAEGNRSDRQVGRTITEIRDLIVDIDVQQEEQSSTLERSGPDHQQYAINQMRTTPSTHTGPEIG